MANALANLETNAWYLCNVGLSVIDQSSILGTMVTTIDHQAEQSWMTPIIEFLRKGVLLENQTEAVKVKARAAQFNRERSAVSMLLLGAILEVLAHRGGRASRGASSPRLMRDAHRRTNVVPSNYDSGLLLVDNEASV